MSDLSANPPAAHKLHRLLYRSACALVGSDETIEAQVQGILDRSRHNNERDDLTGALIRTSTLFIQVLEGPGPALEATFERICTDLRHRDVQLIEFSEADVRAFGGWSMARVQAEDGIEALFDHFQNIRASDPALSGAAAQVVKLMVALIRGGEATATRPTPRLRST